MNADILLPVFAHSFLSADYFCSEVLGLCSFPTYTKFYAKDYVSDMIALKPSEILDNNYLNNIFGKIASDPNPRKTFKAVHISDPHTDFLYMPGMNSNCDNFICCRAETGAPADPKDAAGIWGSYKCDIPHNVLTSMLEYVKDEIKPDMFIWTGDNSAHNVWSNTNEEVIDYVVNITETIKEVFADTKITVFPIPGNHDTWPVNVQSFATPNSNIPINGFKDHWADWLEPETLEVFAKYGYYSQDVKLKDGTIVPNTKVIGINGQPC